MEIEKEFDRINEQLLKEITKMNTVEQTFGQHITLEDKAPLLIENPEMQEIIKNMVSHLNEQPIESIQLTAIGQNMGKTEFPEGLFELNDIPEPEGHYQHIFGNHTEMNMEAQNFTDNEEFNTVIERMGKAHPETIDTIDFNVLKNDNNSLQGMTAQEIIEKRLKEHYNEDFMVEAKRIQKDIIKKAENNDFKGLLALMQEKFTKQEILTFAKRLGISTKTNEQKAKQKAKRKIANKSKRINRK